MESTDSNQFKVSLNTYTGPLDVLLDLAKSQKVNLENISITKLADQFHEFITKAKNLLAWEPQTSLVKGLENSVQWYFDNRDWLKEVPV